MTHAITIGDRCITDGSDAYVIAEIGHNHGGHVEKAAELIRMAAESGAHAAKLQKRDNKALFTKAMYDEPYTGRNSFGATYGMHREAVEFGADEYRQLAALSADLGIDFFATAFDLPSVDFLAELGVPAIKIASGDLTNTPLLSYAAKTGIPLIVSSGGATMDEVRRAVDTVAPLTDQLALLQCTAAYPATPDLLNLRVISTYREAFPDVVVGLSGHDIESESSVIAYTLGARIIEKHVTMDRTLPGSDHHFSLEAGHLRELMTGLDRTRRALGSPDKQQLPVEAAAMRKMSKKLVAARDLSAGEVLTFEDIAIKSPGDGLRPYFIDEIVGRPLLSPLATDDAIQLSLLG
ncbi:N-acetylneuraminate synthase family protein [Streptomyces sp. NPDC059618]|uniref:N-acetylneuraminate synthase family protein n=1 Tax=Streptomyces sp. NPDC059618 TaxID=3346887 RepID=UPI0036875E10